MRRRKAAEVDGIGADGNIIFTTVFGFEGSETFSCCPGSHESPHSAQLIQPSEGHDSQLKNLGFVSLFLDVFCFPVLTAKS